VWIDPVIDPQRENSRFPQVVYHDFTAFDFTKFMNLPILITIRLRMGGSSMTENALSSLQPELLQQTLPQPSTPISSITVLSNSKLFQEGLRALLGSLFEGHNLQIVSCTLMNVHDVNVDADHLQGHVVLIDSSIGITAVLEYTRYWRCRTANVIVVEVVDDPEIILSYVEAGVNAYALCGASVGEVVNLILMVQRGATICSPEVTAKLFQRLAGGNGISTAPRHPLTPRELEVLQLTAKNFSNRQIADALVIEIRTVKHHIHNILRKLNKISRADAVEYALSQGWFTRY
jgi:DNA-binding NarL/FixJ family response regulator